MKIASMAKLFAIMLATSGLLMGCAGSETKEEAPAAPEQTAQPATDTSTVANEPAPAEQPMAASTEESTATHSMAATGSYEVVKGDNLWNISGKDDIYADPYQWPLIYKANRGQIKDADLIYPGQVFDIDRAASQADIDAAINHAKTRGAWTIGTQEASDKAYLGE